MSKLLKFVTLMGIILTINFQVAKASSPDDVGNPEQLNWIGVVSVYNTETGEEKTARIVEDSVNVGNYRNLDGDQVVVYDAIIAIPLENQTRESQTTSKEEAYIKASLTVTYTLGSNNTIKVTNVSGSWTGTIGGMTFKDRRVTCTDGGFHGLKKFPIFDSFSYNTGWGFVDKVSNAWSGPGATSQATGSISGMGGSYQILLYLSI